MSGTTLYCFHHAGGTEFQFRSWYRHLHPSVTVVGIPLENRTSAHRQSIEELAVTAFDFLIGADMTTSAFYGHSMGGHVAYEVCRMLDERNIELPAAVILGGSPAPGSLMHGSAVLKVLTSSGSAPAVVPDYVLRRTAEGVHRSCSYSPLPRPLPIQMDLISGCQDPLVKDDDIRRWQDYCGPTPRYHSINGGHLFHRTDVDEFMSVLRQLIPCNTHLVGTAAAS